MESLFFKFFFELFNFHIRSFNDSEILFLKTKSILELESSCLKIFLAKSKKFDYFKLKSISVFR